MAREIADGDDERGRSPWYRDGAYVNFDDEPGRPYDAIRVLPFLKWRLLRLAARVSPPVVAEAGDEPCAVRPLYPAALAPPAAGFRVAWLGHASVYVVAAGGLRIAIDPLFGAPPFIRRLVPPPIGPDELPPADLLLLTHNHFDHLHPASIAALRRRAPRLRAVVPSGLSGFVRRRLGIEDVTSREWWESVEVDGVKITSVPARHWSSRSIRDMKQSHWAGFAIEGGGRRLFVAGDTAMGAHFGEIAARFPGGFDAAVLPIGAYSPRWFMHDRHMDPPEAVAAARTIGARLILPVHWGTFKLTDEPLGEPPLYAEREARAAGVPIRVWATGEVVEI